MPHLDSLAGAVSTPREWVRRRRDWLVGEVGGPARFRVVALLAGVLALDGADKGTVSSAANNLEQAFGVGNTEFGLLVTASTLVGAVATLPVGALTDRVRRTWLLGSSIVLWSLAMLVSGAAQSYDWMLLSRVALGAVTATAGPTVASLTGDFFPAVARARMYGFILGGELLGTGFGFVVSGYLTAHVGWRWGFWWLVIPSAILALLMFRLAEPARGGQSRLQPGQADIRDVSEVADAPVPDGAEEEAAEQAESRDVAGAVHQRSDIEPYRAQILTEDPAKKSLWWAVGYVLRVRTDVVVIVASALGYFYFSGLRTFAVIFAQGHYSVSKTVASSLILIIGLGALAGVYVGGRFADRLMARGVVAARVVVPVVVLFAISPFLAPAFWVTNLWIAVPLLTVGAGLLGAANPPQDAARLDIIHPHLWGRSEGVRTTLRGLLDAAAPLTFGWVSDNWFGGSVRVGASTSHGSGQALSYTFLVFLVVLIAAGGIVAIALHTYPRDVATADASVRNTLGEEAAEGAS
ncbi:MAG TPA: MFS transporter [Segeticoccus sp.]|uniref:MFS transporter n=1 Tax=Segeticoccus sp. TaxID=2706531 RepID=UPI002D7E433E|nr:MFS transporter [Segeticoccus sp.]HET8602137.1 MFS transporter [Segeticoccus sp.]